MSLGMIHRYVPSYDCRRTIAYGAVREPRMRRVSLVARVPNSHPARVVWTVRGQPQSSPGCAPVRYPFMRRRNRRRV